MSKEREFPVEICAYSRIAPSTVGLRISIISQVYDSDNEGRVHNSRSGSVWLAHQPNHRSVVKEHATSEAHPIVRPLEREYMLLGRRRWQCLHICSSTPLLDRIPKAALLILRRGMVAANSLV